MKNKGDIMVLLESVGTFLDTDNGLTYPAEVNDSGFTRTFSPDLDNPYPLEDIKEDEWVLSLSKEDFDIVSSYLSHN